MNPQESQKPPAKSPGASRAESSDRNLPKAYDPSAIEQRWADYWVRERLFEVPTPATNPGAPHLAPEMWEGGATNSKPFTMLLPPPNVTGYLHMGHMFEHAESDILARWQRMCGATCVWVPGTDHAGIATQMLVERQLKVEGTDRKTLGREAFVERVWAWKRQYGSAITDQMRRLGASVDWSREYFTMDDRLSIAVKEAFVRLYEQGLIYRGAYIVNWDPVQQTAVSDLEVTHQDRAGKLYHIRYPFADGTGSIVVATTRPETMLGDVAVAVNPNDERYKDFIGKLVTLPLSAAAGLADREIPILADDWAQPEFGTGAVKVTPAHDPNDFAIGQRHALPTVTILDETAHVHLPGSPYHGLDRFAARERVVADLEAAGLLVAIKDHQFAIALSQRTGAVIEPRLSMQWFVAVNKIPQNLGAPHLASEMWDPDDPRGRSIAANAIAAVRDGHIQFVPEMYRKTYMEWMTNIHDWCISRQLWWGHRIPAWHCAACHAITVSRSTPTACSTCHRTDIVQSTDVLDTWFSSGLLPFTVFGWPAEQGTGNSQQGKEDPAEQGAANREKGTEDQGSTTGSEATASPLFPVPCSLFPDSLTPDLAAFYPTTQLVTGFDILFFWVARMIMLGCHFMLDVPMPDGSARPLAEAVPFRNVYIHALIRDANREKMSKTKGNVVDPIEIITKYGTDAVRFTLASMASPGTDIAFSEARTEGYRAFANKIWNAARFLFMNLDRARDAGIEVDLPKLGAPHLGVPGQLAGGGEHLASEMWDGPPPNLGPPTTDALESRWILARLSETAAAANAALAEYRFDEAANVIYQFFWGDLCDWYLEIVKLRLNFEVAGEAIPTSERAEEAVATSKAALTTLVAVFEASLRLLSPFMPFLTEEIWHALHAGAPPAKSIALTRYPQPADFPCDAAALAEMQILQELITTIRALRKELGVPEKESAPIRLHAGSGFLFQLEWSEEILARLARVSGIQISDSDSDSDSNVAIGGNNARSTANFDVAVLYEKHVDVAAERERLTKDLAKLEKQIAANESRLTDEKFTAKAPPHIVEGLRKQTAELITLRDKARAALDALPPE
jgi:valyl-tRNA synthetase